MLWCKLLLQFFQITAIEPLVTGLQEALPKSIALLPFDGGVTGICHETIYFHQLNFF